MVSTPKRADATVLSPYGAWLSLHDVPVAVSRRPAARVEEAGYGTLWIPETPTSKEPLRSQGVVPAATQTLQVGTGIANIWARDVSATKNARHTLADAFPGRLVMGLGTSHAARNAVHGQGYDKPLTYMRHYLQAMAELHSPVPPTRVQAQVVLAALRPKMKSSPAIWLTGCTRSSSPGAHRGDPRRPRHRLLADPKQAFVIVDSPGEGRTLARDYVATRLVMPAYVSNLNCSGSTTKTSRPAAANGSSTPWSSPDGRDGRYPAAGAPGCRRDPGAAHPLLEGDGGIAQLEALALALPLP